MFSIQKNKDHDKNHRIDIASSSLSFTKSLIPTTIFRSSGAVPGQANAQCLQSAGLALS